MRMMGIESQYNYTTWQVMEEYIPKRQLMEYRNKFQCFDHQKTGVLSMQDVSLIFEKLGYNLTVNQLEYVLREVIGADCRHTSERVVDFQEFIAIMSFVASNCVDETEMHLVFRQFDMDGDGYISANELKMMLSRLGDEITDAELAEMMRAADNDGDGKVSYQEFVRVMTGSDDRASDKSSTTNSVGSAKDINMNDISLEIDAIAEEECDTEAEKFPQVSRRRSRDDTNDIFTKQTVKHRRSWFSMFSGKRKPSVVRKKKIESRYSCPALLGSYESQTNNSRSTNLERFFSSSTGGLGFRLSSLKRKPKRHSQ